MLKTSNLNLETKKVEGPEIEKRIKFTMTTGPIQVYHLCTDPTFYFCSKIVNIIQNEKKNT